MPSRNAPRTLVRFHVTPRFEIFYALRALGETSQHTAGWRHTAQQLLPAKLRETIKHVAPRPMVWALLADTLRDAKPDPTFAEVISAIESLSDEAFQRAILGGVFRGEKAVDLLLGGQKPLVQVARSESRAGNALVTLLGLDPYRGSSPVAIAFTRIIGEPQSYRSDMVSALDQFWNRAFRESWEYLAPGMIRLARSMQAVLERGSLAAFAQEVKLPIAFDDRRKVVSSVRGSTTFPYEALREINVIPSAFNDTRIWGAYNDSENAVRLYLPVFDPGLLHSEQTDADPEPDPELAFRALGDTTRYAMASFLAESPTTSVELARAFGVSKATISHHVHLLRAAGLLNERATERGVELALDRKAVEKISAAAAKQMFSGSSPRVIRRSRHQAKPAPREADQSPRGAAE